MKGLTLSHVKVTILGAALWAGAFIASAVLFRGRSVGDWIEGLLLAGWIAFLPWRAARGSAGKG